ncbi:hypothetical protein BASA84_001108 [Batrachochytrium salamandrivorans]|nr:hypothetical protein BASA84_001108 [Batrachochytrium salamandrivorans]
MSSSEPACARPHILPLSVVDRERINDKIAQLKTLLPSCANKSGLHKLTIIEEGIHYIRQLEQHLVLLQSQAQPNLASEPKSVLGSTSASVEITCTSKSSASSKPPLIFTPVHVLTQC